MDHQDELSAVTETLGLETPVNGHDISADSSFHAYLSSGSYLDKGDSSTTPGPAIMSYPESNKHGVLSALQSLQEKMKKLEVERRAAESSLHNLASETRLYKTSLHQPLFLQHPSPSTSPTQPNTHTLQEDGEEQEEEEEEEEKEEEKEEREEKREGGHVEICNGGRPQQKQLESQLSTAETRCLLLEKQLEYMRQMVHSTERQRTQAMQKAEVLQQQQQQHQRHQQQQQQQVQQQRQRPSETFFPVSSGDCPDPLGYIGELEKDRLQLTVSQTLAESEDSCLAQSRIEELEARLREERRQRTALPHNTSECSNDQELLHHQPRESSAVPLQAVPPRSVEISPPPPPPPPPPASSNHRKKRSSNGGNSKKKKKKTVTRKAVPVTKADSASKHYRLNLADIPFVAGKSTAPSHAVGANVQKVLAMMKSHNVALCCSSSSSSLPNGHGHNHHHHHHHSPGAGCNGEVVVGRLRSSIPHGHHSPASPPASALPVDLDLGDLLMQLQDEFGQLSLEHQEYLQALQEAGTDPHIHYDLQKELDTLMVRMEVKRQQIAKVKQHQQRLEDARRASKRSSSSSNKKSESVPRPTSALGRLQTNHHKHSTNPNVNGNIRPKSSTRSAYEPRDLKLKEPTPSTTPSLNVLRDMRKLQTTLRRDDLCWE